MTDAYLIQRRPSACHRADATDHRLMTGAAQFLKPEHLATSPAGRLTKLPSPWARWPWR